MRPKKVDGPSLTQLATIGNIAMNHGFVTGVAAAVVIAHENERERHARYQRRRPGTPLTNDQQIPFIKQIISVSKKSAPRGKKRVQAVVRMLGLTFTKHLIVPADFKI